MTALTILLIFKLPTFVACLSSLSFLLNLLYYLIHNDPPPAVQLSIWKRSRNAIFVQRHLQQCLFSNQDAMFGDKC